MFPSPDIHETYTRYWYDQMLVARTISGQKVTGQGHRGHSNFLSCPLRGSVPIWPICFILGTNVIRAVTMCRDPFPGKK